MKTKNFASRFTLVATAMISSLLFFTGCDKEDSATDANLPEGAIKISAETPHSDTKTTVNGLAVYWQDGDEVNLNGNDITVQLNGSTPYLMNVDNTSAMYAGFPASIVSVSGSSITVNIPSTYTYETAANGNQKLDMPMVAHADANATSMQFKHVCSTINVQVSNVLNAAYYIDTIIVTSNSQPLCGTVTAITTFPYVSAVPTYSNATKSVTMRFEKNTVSIAASSSKNFQIPVLMTIEPSTISVRIVGHGASGVDLHTGKVDAAGHIIYHNSASNITLSRASFFTAPCSIKAGIGAISHTNDYPVFSVSASKEVYFSRGNLQFQASTNTWRFTTNQYDYVGTSNANISSSNSGWIDLFGFGTSGKSTGATAYMPYASSTTASEYYSNDLTYNTTSGADWGSNNPYGSAWRTLTSTEMKYLLNTRSTNITLNGVSAARYTFAKVGSVKGVIIFPDRATIPTLSNSTWGTINGASEWGTTISLDDWNLLEEVGCVFLPAAGYRTGTSLGNIGVAGFYWTATNNAGTTASRVRFASNTVPEFVAASRANGMAVRLVQDAN